MATKPPEAESALETQIRTLLAEGDVRIQGGELELKSIMAEYIRRDGKQLVRLVAVLEPKADG